MPVAASPIHRAIAQNAPVETHTQLFDEDAPEKVSKPRAHASVLVGAKWGILGAAVRTILKAFGKKTLRFSKDGRIAVALLRADPQQPTRRKYKAIE